MEPYIPDFLKNMYANTSSETAKGWIVTLAGILNFFCRLAGGTVDGLASLVGKSNPSAAVGTTPPPATVPAPELQPSAPPTPAMQRPAERAGR